MLVFSSRIKAKKKNSVKLMKHHLAQTNWHASFDMLLVDKFNLLPMESNLKTNKEMRWDVRLAAGRTAAGRSSPLQEVWRNPQGVLHAHGWQHLTGLCAYRWGRSLSHTKASRSDAVVVVVCFLEEATSNPLFIHWGPKDPKQLHSDAIKLVLQNIFLASHYLFSHQTPSKLGLDPGC